MYLTVIGVYPLWRADLTVEFKISFLPNLEEGYVFDIKQTPNYLLQQFCSSCYIIKILHITLIRRDQSKKGKIQLLACSLTG